MREVLNFFVMALVFNVKMLCLLSDAFWMTSNNPVSTGFKDPKPGLISPLCFKYLRSFSP